MCKNRKCIDQSIACLDTYDPCADGSSCQEDETSAGEVFFIIIGVAVLVIITGFVINIVWKRRRVSIGSHLDLCRICTPSSEAKPYFLSFYRLWYTSFCRNTVKSA